MNDIDVLVIGGGLQGLVLLGDLTAAGYATLLVTDGELGAGQTLHSHGLLNSGAGLVTGEPQDELTRHVLPRLRRLGVPVYGAGASYLGFPPPAIERLAPLWERRDYHPLPVPAPDLPAGLTSPLRFLRVPGYHVPKRALVDGLSHGLRDRIVRGRVTAEGQGFRIHARHAPPFSVRPQATVVAAGCGTKGFLTDVLGLAGGIGPRITYSTNHMLCLRSPAGVLPAIGTVMTPDVMIAGHVNRAHTTVGGSEGGTISWYVSPPPAEADRGDEAPADATAETNAAAVASAVTAVRTLFAGIDWSDARIEATVFAGSKQDIDGDPTTRLLALCDPGRKVFAALPSVMANTWANSRDLLHRLPGLGVHPGTRSPRLPATPPVAVGPVPELGPAAVWRPFATYAAQAPTG